MSNLIRVLYVDDSPLDRQLVRDSLEKEHPGFVVTEAASRKAFEAALAEGEFEVVLSDFNILGFDGLQVIEAIQTKAPLVPVVLVTGTGSEEIAVEAMKHGASDYVIKSPAHIRRLPQTIQAVLDKKRLEREHEQYERALKESEETFRSLFENSLDAILLTVPDGRVFKANPQACRMFGCTEEEIIEAGRDKLVDTTDPRLRVLLDQRQVTGSAAGELSFKRKDGSVFPAEVSSSIFLDAKGEQRTSMSIRDISARKQAENLLRETEEKYRLLFEKGKDAVMLHDAKSMRFLDANPAAEALWGYTKNELLTMTPVDLSLERQETIEALEKAAQPGGTHVPIRLQRHKDGTPIVVEVSMSEPFTSGNNNVVCSIVRDITDRKKAEEALRQNEQKYRLIVENMHDVVYQTDMEGRVIFGSPSSGQLLGYAPEELLGTRLSALYAIPEERTRFLKLLRKSGSVTGFEAELIRKDGSRVWASTNARLLTDEKGNPVGVEGVTRDISARKKAEETLRDSEERFRLAFDDANIGVCLVDPQGRFVKVNDQMCEMFGYSRAELEGMTVNDIAHPEDTELSPRFMDLASSGEVDRAEFEKRYIHKQGHVVWGRVSSSLVRDRHGNPLYFVSHVQDLTDRKRAEEAAKESEERYRNLVEVSPDGIAVHQEGRIVFINLAGARMLGTENREDLMGKPIQDIVHPDCWEEAGKRIQRMLKGEKGLYQVEDCYVKLDGTPFPVEVVASPFTYGDKPAVQVVVRDITDRKRSEETLRESEARYRYLVENIEDLICTHDPQGNLLFVSPGPAQLLGYTPAEMVGTNLRSYLAPEVRDQLDGYLGYVRRDGRASGHMRVQTRGGENRVWACLSKLHTTPDGTEIVIGIARDVTERRRAEEAERRLATAIDQATEGIVITDTAGTIQYVNPGLERITGYSRDELIGQNTRIFKSGEQDRLFYRGLWETIKTGKIWSGRLVNRKKDGQLYHEDATISPVRDSSGKIINFVAVKRDITENLELSKQLQQAQKMEAVGTLAGGVAHDFNNILQVVVGYSELLLSEEQLPKKFREDLIKMNVAARNGADLVKQLLTFSRKAETKPLHLNLNGRIEQLQKMLYRTISKMIQMELVLSDDLWSVNADPTQVDQVLMNLAVNARDAMPEGGKLIIETKNVTLDEDYARSHLDAKPGSYVLLSISDTGHGMDKDTLQHIFEPFFTTKGLGEGTGLGLATVYGIVKHHDGYITCYSEPGLGTTFRLYFPAVISDEQAIETAPRTHPRGGSETLLLVDDEEFIRDLGARILTKAGYHVVTASNGKEALEMYRSRADEIALIILDLIMPEMDGKQCLEGLLSIDSSVKVVIASGYSANAPTKQAISAGAKGFVNKPYDIRQVLEVVRAVLDGE